MNDEMKIRTTENNGELAKYPGWFFYPKDDSQVVRLSHEQRVIRWLETHPQASRENEMTKDELDRRVVPTHCLRKCMPDSFKAPICSHKKESVTEYRFQAEDQPEGGYVITFPDVPEAITQGETAEECIEMAADALFTAFHFYFAKGVSIPKPGPHHPDFSAGVVVLTESQMKKAHLLTLLKYDEDDQQSIQTCSSRLGITEKTMSEDIGNLNSDTSVDVLEELIRGIKE